MIEDTVTWIPPMDVYEIDSSYIMNGELPGVERRDIKIEFSGAELTIKGERRFDTVCAKESYHRLEGHRGRFHRTFLLPEPVDSTQIQLELKDGIFHLVLPKLGDTKKQSSRGSR
jgi:HSP20 family protein